jgi:hypothetical protein
LIRTNRLTPVYGDFFIGESTFYRGVMDFELSKVDANANLIETLIKFTLNKNT